MKHLLVFVFLWVLFAINCQQTIDGTIYHDGYQREYKLYIPHLHIIQTLMFHWYSVSMV